MRQRKPQEAPESHETSQKAAPKPDTRKPKKKLEDEDTYSPYLDVLRVLTFLFLASCGLSYLISGGETWTWGMKNPPKYLQSAWWKTQLVSQRHYFVGKLKMASTYWD